MEVLLRNEQFNELWFSGFRTIIEKSFIKVDHKINAELILQEIKTLNIDKNKILLTIKNLSEDEWSSQYLLKTLKELDNIIGISDDFLKKHAIQELKDHDLKEVKWEIMKRMMIDYAKFTKEFYDALKYSQNPKLGKEKRLLMISIMDALNKIYTSSKELVDRYSMKKYNASSFRKFINTRIALEHLLLRVYFILLNIDNTDKLSKYRDVLSSEIIEYYIHQIK